MQLPPLDGLKVVELTHMVMGPSVGLILGDLGAEVTRIEPVGGDHTRRLKGSGSGYFPMYNRNKHSVFLDLKSEEGIAQALALADEADVLVENFRPGAMDRLGLGAKALMERNPRLIYCSAKGFLTGPYDKRTALDEVAQMMGGLAYMTGPPGRPLRAGSSVIDVAGGMFGVIGILAALERRHRTGEGGEVACSLYETTAFFVGQHIAQYAVTGKEAAPMPARISAWAVYDVFETANEGEQLFVGVVSDAQWTAFCDAFGLEALGNDPALAENNARVAQRDMIIPILREMFAGMNRDELVAKLGGIGLPYAPIKRPIELLTDEHMVESGALLDVTLPDGERTALPNLPLEIDGHKMTLRHGLPAVPETAVGSEAE